MLRAILCLLSWCFLCCSFAWSQDADYYKAVADTSTNPAVRLVALDSVTSKTKKSDIDTFVEYSKQYITLAKELDSIEAAALKVISLGYTLSVVKDQPASTLTIIDGVLAHKYKIDDPSIIARIYLKRGGANYRLNLEESIIDYENAIDALDEIPVFTHRDSLYLADAHLFSGQAYSNLNNFVPAGENFERAYELFELLGDYEYMLYAQQGLTIMYSMNGFIEKAISEREKNIAKIESLDLDHNLATEYYNQALDFEKIGESTKHIEFLQKALGAHNNNTDGPNAGVAPMHIYAALVGYYCEHGNMERAKGYLNTMENDWDAEGKNERGESHYNFAMATYHYATGDYAKALEYAKKRLGNAKNLNHIDDIIGAHNQLANIYESQGKFEESLENKNIYSRLKDSVYNKSTANSLAYYQTLYETEKTEKELMEKNTSIQLLQKDNEAFRKMMLFGGVMLISIFGMIVLYRNQRHMKNKKILQEQFSQELLVSQEEERKRISKDLHDGLGQRLLVIKNRLVANKDEDTMQMVDTTIDEVRAISRDLHPFQLQEMGITKAIEHTLTQIDENTSLFISSEIDNIDNIFSAEQEVNIYRIVQESLSNILKHAKAEASKVSIERLADNIVISIKDNGIGFDFSEKYKSVKSLGLKTLLERTKFLNGQMKIQSEKDTGTLVEFQFPV